MVAHEIGSPTRPLPRHSGSAFLVTVLAAVLAGAPPAHATHQSGTLTPTTTSVTWTNPLIGGAGAGEASCVEDVNCETFVLTLAPGDYTGKRISVGIMWLNLANDWDLYVHEGSETGPMATQSASGAPQTQERGTIPINPPIVTTARTYYVHAVAFAVADPGYSGDASLVAVPASRAATYLAGTLTFSQNMGLRAPVTTRDGEPSARVDVRGNCYVGGIRGVPAGVDLWRFDLDPTSSTFDPGMQSPLYLGQPDAFLPQNPEDPSTGGADGGGDIDISVNFPTHPDSTPTLTITSLAAANISSAVSFNRGESFFLSPATAIAPADDRQWNESTGQNRVYLLYRAPIPATGLFVQRSDDNGLTYPVGGVVNPSGTTPGYIDVDHTTGRVYAAHMTGNSLTVGNSIDFGMTWRNNTVDNTTDHGTLFDVIKVGDDGTVYALWSDDSDIYLAHSTDGGVTWSSKVRVNENSVYRTNLMPWLEAGSAGRVAVVWYGAPTVLNGDDSDWVVLFSQSLNATDPNPTFRQQVISDHTIHGSNVSLGGLTGTNNRNLIDYFQVALDPQGAAVVAFTDDHNDFDGHLYVTRQLDGASLYAAANGSGTVNPIYPPALPGQDFTLPEVPDFLHDATAGLLQPIITDSPFDIVWIDYACADAVGNPMIEVSIKVSTLAAVPPGVWWRANFTANAPETSPGHPGLSDRGQQFYVRAATDDANLQTFTWGTATRASDGTVAYTQRGLADYGAFDQVNGIITMRVALSQLNAFAAPDIGNGSVLCGLRGQTLQPGTAGSRDPFRDHTRGGGTFTYQACGPTATTLTVFRAEAVEAGVLLRWGFATGAEPRAVEIERSDDGGASWRPLAVEMGREGSLSTALDRLAEQGHTYSYQLVVTDREGNLIRFGPVTGSRDGVLAPARTAFVGSPSPNPTPRSSSVEFEIARSGVVELAVFDLQGARIRTLHAGPLAPGRYTRTWDGRTDRFSDAAPGIYFFVLNTGTGVVSQRVAVSR